MNLMAGLTTFEQLRCPFPTKRIHWRVGATTQEKDKGIALAYIDARDAQQRLDEVMGCDWQCRYTHVSEKGVVCEVGLLLDGEWRWRANGAGETDYEATKGAMSDAFKRACVMWGIGKYLYALPNEWCPIKKAGKSYKLAGAPPELPVWATPEGYIKSLGRLKHHDVVRENIPSIAYILEAFENGEDDKAAEAFAEFTREEEAALDVAPTKCGAAWTTEIRAKTKSEAFQSMVHAHRKDAGWYEQEGNQV